MKLKFLLIGAAALLTACDAPTTPSEPAAAPADQAPAADTAPAPDNVTSVKVNGLSFDVRREPGKNFVDVWATGPRQPFYLADLEAAARAATGCRAKMDLGVLAVLGFEEEDLSHVRHNRKSDGPFEWHVQVSC